MMEHKIIAFTFETAINLATILSIYGNDYVDWDYVPENFQKYLMDKAAGIFDSVWEKIPNHVSNMFDYDNYRDNEDQNKIEVLDGRFTHYSKSLTFYIDRNQWMLLYPKLKDKYEYRVDDRYTCEMVVVFSNIYDDFRIDTISLDLNMDGNYQELQIYPKNKIPKIMTKQELVDLFGEEEEE